MREVVLYSRSPADPSREPLAELIGDRRILMLEACVRPEGVIAVEDPRHGLQRLLPDHGVYFEFVPVDELGRSQPRRLGLGEVTAGSSYALAVTSSPGLWACLRSRRMRSCRSEQTFLLGWLLPIHKAATVRQGLQEGSPVTLGQHARIKNDHQAAIGYRPDQTPESLLQLDHRLRHLVVDE